MATRHVIVGAGPAGLASLETLRALDPEARLTLVCDEPPYARMVLPYYVDGERYVIVGSNGGAANDPSWAHNLRASPEATVHVARKRIPVDAHIADGEERERLWQAITRGRGPYAYYQKQAGARSIPVVVLTPR